MSVEEKGTNTETTRKFISRHTFCGLTVKNLLQTLSQFLLPLILAIFTIVITFDQRNENRIQRLEDRRLSEEQREQDLNISREQRENDRWIAEEQRKYDKQIASDKRLADDLNADIQRNMTRDQRLYEINIEQERYKKDHEKYLDNLLLSYYNEMGDLFQKTNGTSLSFYPISFSLARAKTLNVIQQIGPIRSTHLIMFLYGAGQLTIQNKSIDLSQAYLNYIDLRSQRTLINIYLVGAYLNNASFDGQNISYANFQGAQLNNASFKGSICIGTRFDGAHLIDADFTGAKISNASFFQADLRQSIFHKTTGEDPYFEYTRMQETNFSDVQLNFTTNSTSGFIDSNLARSDFRRAHLEQSRFIYCNLTQADFTDANLRAANMMGSIMSYASFFNTDISFTRLFAANLSYTNLTTIYCGDVIFNGSACNLDEALTLENAYMPNKSWGPAPKPFFTLRDQPYCQNFVLDKTFPFDISSQWKIDPPNNVFNQYRFLVEDHAKYNACVFVPRKTSEIVRMIYRINLEPYHTLIKAGRAKATVHCLVGFDTHIGITELDDKEEPVISEEFTAYRWSALLRSKTKTLQLTIKFLNAMNNTFTWFRYVELDIETDIRAPDTHLRHPWTTYL